MTEWQLSPEVIREATSYCPFRGLPQDITNHEIDLDATFVGATKKFIKERNQHVFELSLTGAPDSSQPGVTFRTDFWMDDSIIRGTVRKADADERDWKSTMASLRTISNIAKALGITTKDAVSALTAPDVATGGSLRVRVRLFYKNNGEIKWEIKRAGRAGVELTAAPRRDS